MSLTVSPSRKLDFISTGLLTGPSSYSTATGIQLDLGSTFKSVSGWRWNREVLGTLNTHTLEHTISGTVITIRVMKIQFLHISQVSTVSSPVVATSSSSNQVVASESTHTHSINHTHTDNSSTETAAGTGVNVVGGTVGERGHTHSVTFDLTGTNNSGAGTSHNHVRNYEYTHDHSFTLTGTDMTMAEVPNTTNISGTSWRYAAIGEAKNF